MYVREVWQGRRLRKLLSVCAFGGDGEEGGAWRGGEFKDGVHTTAVD